MDFIDDTIATAPRPLGRTLSIYKHTYELTVKYVKGKPKDMNYQCLMDLYQKFINRMEDKEMFKFVEIHYENESYLHLHAIIEAPKRIYPYPRVLGYSTKFSQTWKKKDKKGNMMGLSGWIGYMNKENDSQYFDRKRHWQGEQIFKHQYMFQD